MNCLSINISGARSIHKRVWIKKLCNKHKINFLSIQETKLVNVDLVMVHSFWGNVSCSYFFLSFSWCFGGILVIWDPDYFSQKRVFVSDWYVAVEGDWLPSRRNMLFTSVHAPQGVDCKEFFGINCLI